MITGVCPRRRLAPGRGKALCHSQSQTSAECVRGESPAAAPIRGRTFPAGRAFGDPADKESSVRIHMPAPSELREFSTSARLYEKKIKKKNRKIKESTPLPRSETYSRFRFLERAYKFSWDAWREKQCVSIQFAALGMVVSRSTEILWNSS